MDTIKRLRDYVKEMECQIRQKNKERDTAQTEAETIATCKFELESVLDKLEKEITKEIKP